MSAASPRVVIAGAGVGGLTAALALAKSGCDVTLLDRADVLAEAGAGLQLSPNATRILDHLGALDGLRPHALEPEALRIRRGRDGRLLALVPLGCTARARWNAPTLVVHRADFQRTLLDAVAREPSVTLILGTSVAGFSQTPDLVTVGAKRGLAGVTYAGELLVGADGLHSSLRGRLHGEARDAPRFTGRTAWRTAIAAADLPAEARAAETNLWLGHGAHLVHYPLRGGTIVNVVAIIDDMDASDGHGTPLEWNVPGDARRLARAYAGWHRDARILVDAATSWRRWPLFERPALARWSSGRVTLLGDAAHPMLPFLAQGAAQAIEDAGALAKALAEAPHDIPAALAAYEKSRVERANAVQRQSKRQGSIYHLSGAPAFARDLAMQALGPGRLIARYDWVYGR